METKHGVKLSLIMGSVISSLLAKHRHIRQSYFESTSDMLAVVLADTHGAEYETSATMRVIESSIELLNKNEPDWAIGVRGDETNVEYVLAPRDPNNPPSFTVTFYDTPAGQQAVDGFRETLAKGLEWQADGEGIDVRGLPAIGDGDITGVTLIPITPHLILPVRLIACRDGQEIASIRLIQLQLRRRGSEEAELNNADSDNSPLPLTLVVRRSGPASLHWDAPRWIGHSVSDIAYVYEFVSSLEAGTELVVEEAQRGDILSRQVIADGDIKGDLGLAPQLMRNLSLIERETGAAFRLGSDVTGDEVRTAELIAGILQGRPITHEPPMTMTLTLALAEGLHLPSEGVMIQIGGKDFGREVDLLGETFFIYSEEVATQLRVAESESAGTDSDGEPIWMVRGETVDPIVVDKVRRVS
jgi:hypothetical protein